MCKPVSVLASSSPFLLPSKPSLQKAVLNTTCLRPAGVMGVEMLSWGLLALKAWFQLCSWFSTMPNYAGSWTDCSVLHLTLTVHMKYLDCIRKPFLRHTAAMATAFVGSRCSTLSINPAAFIAPCVGDTQGNTEVTTSVPGSLLPAISTAVSLDTSFLNRDPKNKLNSQGCLTQGLLLKSSTLFSAPAKGISSHHS